MSIDLLHDKIRKMKNPSIIDFGIKSDSLPQHLLEEEGSALKAYSRFCYELMDGLKDIAPAVRFPFGAFALLGADGLLELKNLLSKAQELGYYVLLDGPEIFTPWAADRAAEAVFGTGEYPCDGMMISPYIGSDSIKPFVSYCKDAQKDLFEKYMSGTNGLMSVIPKGTPEQVNTFIKNLKHFHHGVSWGGYDGWVSYKYLIPTEYEYQPDGANYWYTVDAGGDPLNMRHGDSTSAKRIGSIPDGSMVKFICYNQDATWAYVVYDSRYVGWVSAEFIDFYSY